MQALPGEPPAPSRPPTRALPQLPHSRRLVIRGRDQKTPAGAKDGLVHACPVPGDEDVLQQSTARVPDAGGAIGSTRGETSAVGAESHVSQGRCMSPPEIADGL